MGKYTKKGKIAVREVSVMEIPLGVRTRARTRALQPNPELSSYLQLRSRRLKKPQFQPKLSDGVGNSRVRIKSESTRADEGLVGGIEQFCDLGNEGFCGDNNFEYGEIKSTRESTPCSLIRDMEVIRTPGSTTRPMSATRRARNAEMTIPTTLEIEEFFVGFELLQQKQFIDKYNYDIMKDLPIPGRYEWVRVDN